MDPSSGGPCQGIRNSVPALEALGVRNEVVCLDDPAADFVGDDPFPVHALGPCKGPWAYASGLRPWLRENLARFDAVLVHGLWLYHSHAARLEIARLRKASDGSFTSANRQASTDNPALLPRITDHRSLGASPTDHRVPKVCVMPHGMLDPWFQRATSRRLKAWRNTLYWHLIERGVVADADALFFTCEQELRLARQTFFRYRPRAEISVGYGVPEPPPPSPEAEAAFRRHASGLGDRPYLLFLSRIHPKKGVDLLLRAYTDLAKHHFAASSPENCKLNTDDPARSTHEPASLTGKVGAPRPSRPTTDHRSLITDHSPLPSLVIAGPLDSAYAHEMQQLAEELMTSSLKTENSHLNPPKICFVGMLQGDAKWGAFHGCEAFVLPSHQENFGIAVAEALACGKPVLISNQVNIWREIEEAGGGLIAADTAEAVSDQLAAWHATPAATRQAMASAARAAYDRHFAVAPAARSMLTALQSLAIPPKMGRTRQ